MTMNQGEVMEVLRSYGVLQHGHFKLSSGRHSDTYLQCARVLQYPHLAESFGQAIANRYRSEGAEESPIDVVVSPAVGGIVLGFAVALEMGCRMVFSERESGRMTLRRGFEIYPAERALVVEDVVTTGGSLAEVVDLVRSAGAEVVGVASLVDRTSGTEVPFSLQSLAVVQAKSWDPSECALCRSGEPVHSPGSRRLSGSG
jgi:orotate phosphoribosyltransferase